MNQSKRHKVFVDKINELTGDDYSVLTEYKGVDKEITVRHNICGYEYTQKAKRFIESRRNGSQCLNCLGRIVTTESFKEKIKDLFGNEYIIISEYQSAHEKIKVKHNECGNNWLITPHNLSAGYGCPYCYGNIKKTTKEFKEEMFDLEGSDYKVLGEYTQAQEQIKVRHEVCGNVYEVTPDNFLRGKRCPDCQSSKGEEVINQFLNDHDFVFKREYSFDDCKNVKKLRFDFALFQDNNLVKLVEYDGIQHFKPTFGKIKFKGTLVNDDIKNNYCEKNNIPLLRIPYTDFENLGNVLEEKLMKYVQT